MQDKAAAQMHNENKIFKKQLIGLLAKVLYVQQRFDFGWYHMVQHVLHVHVSIQMVGASAEEVEVMGKDSWDGEKHFCQVISKVVQ